MVDIRLPKITGATEREQLSQVKSYLYQLAEQLQFALNDINTSSSQGYVQMPQVISTPSVASQGYAQQPLVIASEDDSTIDAQATFDAVKGLIIKSAEIVEAYYEEINHRLEGIYVAESDFGAFVQQTSQDIENSSMAFERSFTNIQEISGQLDDDIREMKSEVDKSLKDLCGTIEKISHTLVEVNANIRSGLLYYDDNGVPVYGLEVGQRTKLDGVEVFDKFARFTSDRLSFYDQNDTEVAYISDRKLYINHVEVRGTFRMGGFVKTVLADLSIVKRWVDEGGEG